MFVQSVQNLDGSLSGYGGKYNLDLDGIEPGRSARIGLLNEISKITIIIISTK
jgi:hypothetical protein